MTGRGAALLPLLGLLAACGTGRAADPARDRGFPAAVRPIAPIVSDRWSNETARDRANEAYEAALPHARRALDQVKAEGSAVAEATREHPVGIGGVVILATALGMMVGYALGAATQSEPRSWWRDYF